MGQLQYLLQQAILEERYEDAQEIRIKIEQLVEVYKKMFSDE